MEEQTSLVQDFAVILAVGGAITVLFRKLRQPPILGYLLAGLIIGPYTLPSPPVTDIHMINLLADLGLVFLLFGMGLEFGWSKVRQIPVAVFFIGFVQIVTMLLIGFGLGKVFGWSNTESIFFGAAINVTSTVIVMKILGDLGRMDYFSTKLILGVVILEDCFSVVILTIISGMATTGTTNLGDIGALIAKLIVFILATLALGTWIVPKVMKFAHALESKEALLIITLGLCFLMAQIGRSLGLSEAAGAFLMGSLVCETNKSEEVINLINPLRDIFAAIFFVTIGMLVDIHNMGAYIVYGLVTAIVFIVGKIFINSFATLMSGYNNTVSVEVGTAMSQMGEFSLAIAKFGVDRGNIKAPLYPVIAIATTLTSVTSPYLIRSANAISGFVDRRLQGPFKKHNVRVANWLNTIRSTYSPDIHVGAQIRIYFRNILISIVIVAVIIGTGAYMFNSIQKLLFLRNLRNDVVGVLYGLGLLTICIPSLVVIWRNLQLLVNEATIYFLRRRQTSAWLEREAVRLIIRDTILVLLSIFVLIWFIPFFADLLSIRFYALVVPAFILALILYILIRSVRRIHGQMEQNFSRIFTGKENVKQQGSGLGSEKGAACTDTPEKTNENDGSFSYKDL